MFKIKKLTKYTLFALAIAFAIFIAVPTNSVKAGDDDYYYLGNGYGDSYDYSYSEPTSYYNEPDYYYSEPTSYYPEPSSYYPEPDYYYSEPTSYYNEPDYYSQSSYYEPSYSYGSSYSGCSSYSCGGGYTYTPPPQIVYVPQNPPVYPPVYPPVQPPVIPQSLDASCVISPNNVYINDTVTLSGHATGGTGSYTYYWSGSDGISGSSQVITGRFTSAGSKYVSLTVTSGSQTVTRTCNAYVNQNNNYNYNYNNGYNYNYNYNNGYNYNYANLTATCSAVPTNANVGDNVIWTVYPNGGNGVYTYTWTGSDGLSYGNANQIQQRYTTPGTKTATVVVYTTNGQSVTATCNTNIMGSISAGTPISGIYLNEVPATGIDFNLKVALYTLGLILWSAFVGFMLVEKRKTKLALANRVRIEDFKQENLKRKGLL